MLQQTNPAYTWYSFACSVLVFRIFSWFLLYVQAQSPEGLTPQGLDGEQLVPDYPIEDQGAVESVDLISFAYQIASGTSVQAKPPIQT